ncbi:ferrous iron transport protein A [Salipaludibacillus sp. LMS25]|uniref:FeoA family protein n=1 Tax=Salipaludibacillus sp. LMS25 TaxID=2924031 RepID=UPI0020D09B54|nr:FeoA family protein [Salipaludibacillus sp. LMS25]UTR16411.1 ferrous iron transport protein A [Salipaludibacillus sp. LMS25]
MVEENLCTILPAVICKIVSVPDLPMLSCLGVHIGTKLTVVVKNRWKGPVVIKLTGKREIAIDYHVASQIIVEEVEQRELSF